MPLSCNDAGHTASRAQSQADSASLAVLYGAPPLTTTMAKDAQGPTSGTEKPEYAHSEIQVVCSPGNASDNGDDARQRVDSSDRPPGNFH